MPNNYGVLHGINFFSNLKLRKKYLVVSSTEQNITYRWHCLKTVNRKNNWRAHFQDALIAKIKTFKKCTAPRLWVSKGWFQCSFVNSTIRQFCKKKILFQSIPILWEKVDFENKIDHLALCGIWVHAKVRMFYYLARNGWEFLYGILQGVDLDQRYEKLYRMLGVFCPIPKLIFFW